MNLTLISPETFIQLADGKLNGQKAFMTGALKVKGNIMLAVRPYREPPYRPSATLHGCWLINYRPNWTVF